jgi:hypothetical protein
MDPFEQGVDLYPNRRTMLLASFNGSHKLKKFQHIGIKNLWTEIGAVPRRRHYQPPHDVKNNIYLDFDFEDGDGGSHYEHEIQHPAMFVRRVFGL